MITYSMTFTEHLLFLRHAQWDKPAKMCHCLDYAISQSIKHAGGSSTGGKAVMIYDAIRKMEHGK